MPLRFILRYLMQNEQLIQKLADSYPIRAAARLTTSLFYKGKEMGENNLEKLRESEALHRLQNEAQHSASKVKDSAERSVQRTNNVLLAFFQNLEEEWEKGKKQLEEQREREEAEKRGRDKD
ncbi:hypothetical protein PoB_004943500 [Plakobranchus ocellatus]|uniref:Uncharacterized protein n=1 Tax=Plakobranchus ocellatus TaxID=259542 RepID=A0AAV4BQP7_9GAST|nr:hypothetical protein PoB_004943500 [Plakobranchus ocellatus]